MYWNSSAICFFIFYFTLDDISCKGPVRTDSPGFICEGYLPVKDTKPLSEDLR